MTGKPARNSHVPRRRCVQCGTDGAKPSFLRVAGRPGTGWEPDPDGRKPGLGLYVCRNAECVERFTRRIRSEKGGARWKMGSRGAELAEQLTVWWAEEVMKAGGMDG
jgi:predicted RNA-binding protein YlxR (DUF448 family)